MKARLLLAALTAVAATGFAPAAVDAARLEGGYALLPKADAGACALACEEDGLCMSWAFAIAEGQCALSAVTPSAAAAPGVTVGLASRAPKFDWAPAVAPAADPAPQLDPAPQPSKQAAAPGPFDPSDPAVALLGGPAGAPGLRLRLGDDRP